MGAATKKAFTTTLPDKTPALSACPTRASVMPVHHSSIPGKMCEATEKSYVTELVLGRAHRIYMRHVTPKRQLTGTSPSLRANHVTINATTGKPHAIFTIAGVRDKKNITLFRS